MSVGTLNTLSFDATAESTYGTQVASGTPDRRWPFRGNRPGIRVETADDSDSLTGVIEGGLKKVVTKRWMEASYDFDLRMDLLPFLLKAVMGSLSTSGAGPYVHTLTVNQGNTPAYDLFWSDANTTASKLEVFTGVKVKRVSIKGSAGGKITVTADLIGSGGHSEVTATAPSQNTDTIVPFSAVSAFTVGSTDYKAKLLDFEIVFESVLDEGAALTAGSVNLSELLRVDFKASGRFSVKWEENGLAGLMAAVEAQTAQAIVLTITSGAHSATFNVYASYLSDGNPDGQKAKLKQAIAFEGVYDTTATKKAQATVTNGTAGTAYA